MIFVNLPVADLAKSKAFYEAIDAVIRPKFTDETTACMVFSDTIFIMLLTHDKFRQFTSKRSRMHIRQAKCCLSFRRKVARRWMRSALA